MKWAYIDESIRPGRMVLAAVVVDTRDVRDVRLALRSALLPGQRRLHLTDERPSRRHLILDLVARQPLIGLTASASTHGHRHADVRHDLLTGVVRALAVQDVRRMVLDRVAEELLEVDRATISAALVDMAGPVIYDHEPSAGDPMLWAADALAWSVGAGGHSATRLARILRSP